MIPNDPIRHVVLLMMENRSFDHMLGAFSAVVPGLDGVDPAKPGVNCDQNGKAYQQAPTLTRQTKYDPKHELADVAVQLENTNGGFIRDFVRTYPQSTEQDRQEIMNYYPVDFLPGLHSLARDFTICDRWYSSVPGPTWTNRFFALSGTSLGRVVMPAGFTVPDLGRYFQQTQETVFDRLNEAGRSWKVYYYDFPSSWLLLRQLLPQNLVNYRSIDDFFADVRDEPSFPDFVFLEPKYFGQDENDDHPPHNIMKGEKLIADVYNAIRSSPDLWKTTLFAVLFDEHGGFYDHVPPPGAVAPDDHQDEYAFDRLGVRVPALLVSPWVSRGVEHTQFDHTSLLQYLTVKWGLGPLGRRTAAAASVGVALRETAPRTDTIPFIRVPYSSLIPARPDWEAKDGSGHHEALQAFAQHLENQAGVGATRALAADNPAARMTALADQIRSGALKINLDPLGRGHSTAGA